MKEILSKDEKEAFEQYANYIEKKYLYIKKEDFEFTKLQNPMILAEEFYILKVINGHFHDKLYVKNGVLEGMILDQTYTWKELGL